MSVAPFLYYHGQQQSYQADRGPATAHAVNAIPHRISTAAAGQCKISEKLGSTSQVIATVQCQGKTDLFPVWIRDGEVEDPSDMEALMGRAIRKCPGAEVNYRPKCVGSRQTAC